MRRGEIWWATLLPPIGRRPVLILSRDSMPQGRREITVAYLTSTIRHKNVEVLLARADGVPRPCVVNLDSINTVDKRHLDYRICQLSAQRMEDVGNAILEALGMKQ